MRLAVNAPVTEVVAALERRGVSFRGPVIDGGGGIALAFFANPDGNPLYLAGPRGQETAT